MKWTKIAHLNPEIPGLTHAALPFYFEGDVYFSPRDGQNRSNIYRASFNPKTLALGKLRAYLLPGERGAYDDAGCMVSWLKRDGPRVLCYFIGWNLPINVPFRNCIGLAIDQHKLYGPIKDRDLYDPYGVGSCCDGLRYYLSILGWEYHGARLQARYHIVNGRPHSPAITFKDETEYAIARPCVVGNEMWYCYRGEQYRIGYAVQTPDHWTRRDDEAGITVGKPGEFDDEAICYPHVFDLDGERYMLYNGNEYGKTGFGLAVMS